MADEVEAKRGILTKWADLLSSEQGDSFREQELLPDFITDVFCNLLGYERPADNPARYTRAREKYVEVDGKFADAVLGEFKQGDPDKPIVALEGKGPKDPLERPFAGRKKSAVDQGYGYAINLPCDWIIVTSMRQTRLYHKGSDQQTYERFDIGDLATSNAAFRKFVFLFGAERVVPVKGDCHFWTLKEASEKIGRRLTKKFYIEYADIRQDVFETLCEQNASESQHKVLTATQKLLDRVLFTAFCEDRGLLPDDTLKRAFEHNDPYNPRPIWTNFRGLFRSIDAGNPDLNIPPYNGGLFADDPFLEQLTVPDSVCSYFRDLGEYEYRPPSEVEAETDTDGQAGLIDVEILGHIFEQSITDLEQIRNELDGLVQPAGKEKHKTRRKKEGAFYTPAFITRYIIEQTLGGVLEDRFERLRQSHAEAAKGTAAKSLADPSVYDLAALNNPQREALVRFWEAWQDELATIRILDPACGSGAFLIEAFDQLHATYQASNDRLEELRGHRTLFDLDRRILQNNLFGVDLNEEAIEICRLSLWIKTAERGKTLTSLDETIRVGNSVVNDPLVHPKAFNWQQAFPEVIQSGGFDAVVANPPYIRQEWLSAYKSYWSERYPSVYSGTADIYVYFYAIGFELLKHGGRLAFISSNSFARAAYADKLRRFFADTGGFEQFVDLGDTRVFADAKDVYPAIVVVSKPSSAVASQKHLRTTRLRRNHDVSMVDEIVRTESWEIPTSQLKQGRWDFDNPAIIQVREKIIANGITLDEYCDGKLLYGIKTGLNDAFVIDDETRMTLIESDPASQEIIKPFLRGLHMRRWFQSSSSAWLLFCRRGIDIETFPAIRDYLELYRERLEPRPRDWDSDKGGKWKGRKPGPYEWYELQDAVDYWKGFDQPKIVWPDIAKSTRFSMDLSGAYPGNTGYAIANADYFLLGVLNSDVTWFALKGISTPFGERAGEFRYRLIAQYMEKLPIPIPTDESRQKIAELAESCNGIGQQRYDLQESIRHRLLTSFGERPDGTIEGKLNKKASAWWQLTLNQLGSALKTSFKLKRNPFQNPNVAEEWESYLAERKRTIQQLSGQLRDAEAELNDRVYRLFNLTDSEIKILQREVEH